MNELQEVSADKIVNVRQAEHEKQNKLISNIRPRRGHTVFEYNIETNEINKAKVERIYVLAKEGSVNKIQANKNCLYVSALNVKNAIKKLKKRYA